MRGTATRGPSDGIPRTWPGSQTTRPCSSRELPLMWRLDSRLWYLRKRQRLLLGRSRMRGLWNRPGNSSTTATELERLSGSSPTLRALPDRNLRSGLGGTTCLRYPGGSVEARRRHCCTRIRCYERDCRTGRGVGRLLLQRAWDSTVVRLLVGPPQPASASRQMNRSGAKSARASHPTTPVLVDCQLDTEASGQEQVDGARAIHGR